MKILRWLAWITVATFGVLGMLPWLAFGALWFLFNSGKACDYEVLGNASGIAGFDFETSIRDCWHNPETSVFVSKPGGGRKTVLFSYVSPDAPTITATDDRTIQITLGDIDHVFCRTDKWEGLTVDYVIRSIRRPGIDAPRKCNRSLLLDFVQRAAAIAYLTLQLVASLDDL